MVLQFCIHHIWPYLQLNIYKFSNIFSALNLCSFWPVISLLICIKYSHCSVLCFAICCFPVNFIYWEYWRSIFIIIDTDTYDMSFLLCGSLQHIWILCKFQLSHLISEKSKINLSIKWTCWKAKIISICSQSACIYELLSEMNDLMAYIGYCIAHNIYFHLIYYLRSSIIISYAVYLTRRHIFDSCDTFPILYNIIACHTCQI